MFPRSLKKNTGVHHRGGDWAEMEPGYENLTVILIHGQDQEQKLCALGLYLEHTVGLR